MELWLRYRKANELEFDASVTVESHEEWRRLIDDRRLISSILWPDEPIFRQEIQHMNRHHHHELEYCNDSARNASYLDGCRRLAKRLDDKLAGKSCLVYAPLRGALPIWRGIRQAVSSFRYVTYYPVTSSFVFYPAHFGITGKRNRPASGRYNNRFELERIRPFLGDYDVLLYVDEIVSGGMLWGHLKDMFRIDLPKDIPIIAVGLADDFGARSASVRDRIAVSMENGLLADFIWEGCPCLITEDQKFLLGTHYVDYNLGPHVVPLLNDDLNFFEEKRLFDLEVFQPGLDRFTAPL